MGIFKKRTKYEKKGTRPFERASSKLFNSVNQLGLTLCSDESNKAKNPESSWKERASSK
jgi:hypothetical protein